MAFACPGCSATVRASPERAFLRCPACGERLRAREAGSEADARLYDVELLARPETRTRIHVAWSAEDARRLRRWLVWSSVITLGLVGVLFVLARLLP